MYSTPLNTAISLSQWKDQDLFVQDNPQFSQPQVRYIIRQRFVNGLSEFNAIRKVGRRLYIHEHRFSEWLEQLGNSEAKDGCCG